MRTARARLAESPLHGSALTTLVSVEEIPTSAVVIVRSQQRVKDVTYLGWPLTCVWVKEG